MRNQAINLFDQTDNAAASTGGAWQVDESPKRRLLLLFLFLLFPIGAIVGRLIYLQTVLSIDFVFLGERTSVTYERIPARDGRILGSDGRILAHDIVRYDLLAHYRWIESPADRTWLLRQASGRLNRAERRSRKRRDEEREKVLQQRTILWNRLAELTVTDPQKIGAHRQRIQRRIERMLASVKRRREEKMQQKLEANGAEAAMPREESRPFWKRAWDTVTENITTPPERHHPLFLPEQSQYHRLLSDVPKEVAAEIQAHPELYPGIRIQISNRRVYPQKSLAAHLVGSRLLIQEKELEHRKTQFNGNDPLGYQQGDRIGKTGLERTYDRFLRGRPGQLKVTRNHSGEVIRSERIREPQAGQDIVLTLELELQQRMEQLLDQRIGAGGTVAREAADSKTVADKTVASKKPRGGCLVAIDIQTGSVLAAVAAPRFDLNVLVNYDDVVYKKLLNDPRRPFFPRTTQMALPPGSVFKTLSSIALLESGTINPDAPFSCQGYLKTPDKHRCYIFRHFGSGHGPVTLNDAITRSCNVYFFNAARKLGPEPFVTWAKRFGFGQRTGIDLPNEKTGHLPQPPVPQQGGIQQGGVPRDPNVPVDLGTAAVRSTWYADDTLGLAIGQSRLTVTPFQIARMMAAIANEGSLVTPHLVRRLGAVTRTTDNERKGNHETIMAYSSHAIPELSADTLARLHEGLRRVVQHPQGTGFRQIRLTNVTIAGKTGTAEVGKTKPPHAWFAGYVPADNPRIAFAIVLENAGIGGLHAGPVAKEFVKTLLELKLIVPQK